MNQAQLIKKFGNPMTDRARFERKWMTLVDLSDYDFLITPLPTKAYMNKLMQKPFMNVLEDLRATGLYSEIRTWDGLYNVRYMRGSKTQLSRHSWGLAIDMNASWNPLVKTNTHDHYEMRKRFVKWSEKFLQVWRDNGFECGADWKGRLDGMHFEFTNFD